MTRTRRGGATLIELIVTVAVLGILSGVATMSLLKGPPVDPTDLGVIAARLRRNAARTGTPESGIAIVDSVAIPLTAFPDGSIAADSSLHVDLLTGRVSLASP